MTREEEIKRLKRLKARCERLIVSSRAGTPEEWRKDAKAIDVALSALRPVSREQLEEKAREYNAKAPGKTAYIQEIEEGSLMDYLLEQAENASGLTKNAIEDALYALDQARDAIQSLER